VQTVTGVITFPVVAARYATRSPLPGSTGTSIAACDDRSIAAWERLERGGRMLWTIFVILVVMWLLGMVSGATLGGFIHLLLLLAIAVVLIRIIGGRAPV
jgi:hypothetical protein